MILKGDTFNKGLLFGGLLAFIFLVYSSSMNSYFVTDDFRLIYISSPLSVNNYSDFFTSSGGFFGGYYRPLVRAAFFIDYSIYHLNPAGYHITNLLLHFIVTIMVFYFTKLVTDSEKAGGFAAFVFAIHPLHTESVTWISGRGDIILSVFYLLSVLSFIKHISAKKKGFFYLTISVASFIAALLTKETAVTLPLILFLTNLYWNRNKRKEEKHNITFMTYLPFAVVFLLYALVKLFIIKGTHYGSSIGLDTIQRVAYHFVQLFAPINIDTFRMDNIPQFILNSVLVLIFAGMLHFYWHFSSDKREASPLYIFLILWILITWFPLYFSSGVRFTYISTIASSAAMGFIFVKAVQAVKDRHLTISRVFAPLLIITILITFSIRTIERNRIYNYAGSIADSIMSELKNSHPVFKKDSVLYFINFPDKWVEDTEAFVKPIPVMGMAVKVNYNDDSLLIYSKSNLSTAEDKRMFLEEKSFRDYVKQDRNCNVFEYRDGRVIEVTDIFSNEFKS